MKTAINANAIAAVALLSRYNFYTVHAENADTGKTSSFCATGIILRKSGCLWFTRQFTTPVITAGAVEELIAVNDSKCLFLCGDNTVYTVEASNKAFADYDDNSGNVDDPASLIDWHRSEVDEAGNKLVVLDLRKLGDISKVQYSHIKNYMNIFLGGLPVKMQICRTIYIEAANNGKITVGLYNLEQEQRMTAIPVRLEAYTEDEASKIKRLFEVVGDKLGEVIPQF